MGKRWLLLTTSIGLLLSLPASASPQVFVEHVVQDDFDGACSVYAIDLDHDGDRDVLGTANNTGEVVWWENRGAHNFSKHTIREGPGPADAVYASDLEGDGDIDVLATLEDAIAWWENDGHQNFAQHIVDNTYSGANGLHAADVDGDGDVDLLGAAINDDDITWWENNPSVAPPPADPIAWTEHTIDGNFHEAYKVHAIDIDGDGDTDVLGTAEDAPTTWWENAPSGNPPPSDPAMWTEHVIEDHLERVVSIRGADIDGDGDTDVLGAVDWDHTAVWWENVPSYEPPPADPVTWIEHIISAASSFTDVYATDLDGDGDVDVLTAAVVGGISWWENGGQTPPQWTRHIIGADFDFALSVYAADLDGDCDTDVLGAASWADRVSWWESTQDFDISSDTALVAVCAGESADSGVTISRRNGFVRPVTLGIGELPTGAAVSFVPNPVAAGDVSTMTIVTDATTPGGTYPLEVSGTSVYPDGCPRTGVTQILLEVHGDNESVSEVGSLPALSLGLAVLATYVASRRREPRKQVDPNRRS